MLYVCGGVVVGHAYTLGSNPNVKARKYVMVLLLYKDIDLKMPRTNPGYIVAWKLTDAEVAMCFFKL